MNSCYMPGSILSDWHICKLLESSHLHNRLVRLLFLFYRGRDRGKERLSDLLEFTELIRDRVKT